MFCCPFTACKVGFPNKLKKVMYYDWFPHLNATPLPGWTAETGLLRCAHALVTIVPRER